jgi:hypothetical protein
MIHFMLILLAISWFIFHSSHILVAVYFDIVMDLYIYILHS